MRRTGRRADTYRTLLGPGLRLLPLPGHLLQIRLQVSALLPVLLISWPLVLGQNCLHDRALHCTLDTEGSLVQNSLWHPLESLLNIIILIQSIIVVQAVLIETRSIKCPLLDGYVVDEGSVGHHVAGGAGSQPEGASSSDNKGHFMVMLEVSCRSESSNISL